ncbi:MAG TPA: helix-turn-helix transcriptional regulator [Bacillota bacterium]|nr:helix-turn-helix transcriptional regulator [Bacillota bacterium]HOO11754.1 helix-turn-helix transcriptional regulator [Bacillota bacterium]
MPVDEECQHGIDSIKRLTPREKQVFYMLLEGMKAKEIALNASISVSGANYFIKRIYRKLNVNTKTELVLRYFEFRQHKDK